MSNIENARNTNPEIYFTIECYHKEIRKSKNANGVVTRTEEKVVTHHARQVFNCRNVSDDSAPGESVDFLKYLGAARLKTKEIIHYEPRAW